MNTTEINAVVYNCILLSQRYASVVIKNSIANNENFCSRFFMNWEICGAEATIDMGSMYK